MDEQAAAALMPDKNKSGGKSNTEVEQTIEMVTESPKTDPGDGLGANGESDFSIGPNAEYYVPRPDDVFTRLSGFIATSRGGVFGITGVRGAGKSVLLNRIKTEFENKHHTLPIPAPVSSNEETAFLTMLFRQLCRSVIKYINEKVLKKEEELALLRRQEYLKRLYPIFFLLPFLSMVFYGGWFYWMYYSDYKEQRMKITSVLESQYNLLSETHLNEVAGIVGRVKEGSLTIAQKESPAKQSTSAGSIRKLENQVKTTETIRIVELDEKVGQANGILQPLLFLQKWEKRFAEEFASWQKPFNKIPHPLQVLLFEKTSSKGFSIERFFGNQKKAYKLIIEKYSLSVEKARAFIDEFKMAVHELKIEGLNEKLAFDDKWLAKVATGDKNLFNTISEELNHRIDGAQAELDKARQELLTAQGELKKLRDRLIKEQKEAVKSVGGEAKAASKKALETARVKEKKILQLSSEVESAIKKLATYPDTLAFDVFNSKNWRSLRMPSEIHSAQTGEDQRFGKLLETIDASIKTFIANIGKIDIVPGYAQNLMEQYAKNLDQAQGFLRDAMERIKTMDTEFLDHRNRGIGPLIVVAIAVGSVLAFVMFLFLAVKAKQALKHGDVLGLRKQSEDIIRNLDYEVTKARGSKVNLPLLKRLGASFSFSEQQRGRAQTLPGLTARYIEYIHSVQRVLGKKYGSKKLIICIDELDKITDPEQVGNVLREIKGALYEKDCFYLLSISEDAVRAFEARLVKQRDIFESTFDEIMFLDKMDLETCVDVARKRSRGAGYGPRKPEIPPVQEAIEIAAVLSSGVPRELLRNLRAVENVAGSVLKFEPSLAWHTLYKRKLKENLQNVRTANGQERVRADFIAEIENYLACCETGYDENLVQASLAEIRKRNKILSNKLDTLQAAFESADNEFHAVAIKMDIEHIQAWLKYSMEQEIHLMLHQCSLTYNNHDTRNRSRIFANLLAIYGSLPYSTEATARRLSRIGLPAGALSVVSG